jgi:hypothetical protein
MIRASAGKGLAVAAEGAGPSNVQGNRRGASMLAEVQGINRRVRLTVGLGVMLLHSCTAASA